MSFVNENKISSDVRFITSQLKSYAPGAYDTTVPFVSKHIARVKRNTRSISHIIYDTLIQQYKFVESDYQGNYSRCPSDWWRNWAYFANDEEAVAFAERNIKRLALVIRDKQERIEVMIQQNQVEYQNSSFECIYKNHAESSDDQDIIYYRLVVDKYRDAMDV